MTSRTIEIQHPLPFPKPPKHSKTYLKAILFGASIGILEYVFVDTLNIDGFNLVASGLISAMTLVFLKSQLEIEIWENQDIIDPTPLYWSTGIMFVTFAVALFAMQKLDNYLTNV